MMRVNRGAMVSIACILAVACSSSPTGSGSNTPAPVTIDGVKSAGEWDDATSVAAFSGATFYYKVIGDSLYVAFQVSSSILTPTDAIDVRFDNTHSGTLAENDDEMEATGVGYFIDGHAVADEWGYTDREQNGVAAAANANGVSFFEFAHPLDSGDPQDFALQPGDVVGYCLAYVNNGSTGDATTHPTGCLEAGNDLSGYATLTIH
jgi:hypothetical protein